MRSTKHMLFCAATLAASLMPPAVFAQSPAVTSQSPAAYTLLLKFTAGEVLKYSVNANTTSSVQVGGQATTAKGQSAETLYQRVQSVNSGDGSAVVVNRVTDFAMSMNGVPMPSSTLSAVFAHPITATITPSGSVANVDGIPAATGMSGSASNPFTLGATLPSTPVAIGSTWTVNVALSKLPFTMQAVMTLKSVQQVEGVNVAEIDSTYTETPTSSPTTSPTNSYLASTSTSGTSVTMFDIDDGRVQSETTTMTVNSSTMNIVTSTTQQLLKVTI